MSLDLDLQEITNVMKSVGWMSLPPDDQAELIRHRQGDSVILFRAGPILDKGRVHVGAHDFVAELGKTPLFVCPLGQRDLTYMFFEHQRFYETRALKDDGEATPYLFDTGMDRVHLLVAKAQKELVRNTRYAFNGIYGRMPAGAPSGKATLGSLSP